MPLSQRRTHFLLPPDALRASARDHFSPTSIRRRTTFGHLRFRNASRKLVTLIRTAHGKRGTEKKSAQWFRIAERYRLVLIEDAAQAIGAEFPSRERIAKAGTMGEVGFFSFYPSKNLGAAGDAGMIVCGDEQLAQKLRTFREHGMEPRYFHHVIGGNFRLDEIQAAILAAKLPYLEKWAAARRAAADFYGSEFVRVGLIETIAPPTEPYRDRGLTNHHVYHQYVIRTPMRDALREHLAKREVETAIYYPLGLHEQKCFAYLGYKKGDFLETERAARETLALPIYPEVSREAQRYVVSAIAEFLS